MRAGPGLGNIGPEQSDYFQMVKGGGHGSYRNIVLAPNCAQEMCDLTRQAFEIADRFRNPVIVLTDGFVGQMMEPVAFPEIAVDPPVNNWAVQGNAESRGNLVSSIYLKHEEQERHVQYLQQKYVLAEACCTSSESYRTDDADIILVGYGIVSRILRSTVDLGRKAGLRVGLLRPVSLWPFPKTALQELAAQARCFLVCELSLGQMVEDVRLCVQDRAPVYFYGRQGGLTPTPEEVLEKLLELPEVLPAVSAWP
jgi:pyruvate/2-oxoacid:ferredoxin oxidoreductase alpha subunit